MELDEKRFEPNCPIVDIDGYIANGKQYDLDITLAQDNRDVIYGIVRNCFKDPVKDAVVKLVEVDHVKICAKCHREGRCLKGVKLECDCKKEYDFEEMFPCKKEENMKEDCNCNKEPEKECDVKPNCPPKKEENNCGCNRY